MFKKELFLLVVLSTAFSIYAQTPSKYKYKGKEYYVYPFRINNTDDIPAFITSVPDGDYIAFHDYVFKRNRLSIKKETRYKLNDTALVGALFSLKNNVPDGLASFYYYDKVKGDNTIINPKPYSKSQFNYTNGLKNGDWKWINLNDNSHNEGTYKDGLSLGYFLYYNGDNTIKNKDKYYYGKLCDTVFEYKNNKAFIEYDVDTVNVMTNINNNTVYYLALKDIAINPYKNCKSYFKQFDTEGKLAYELKYKNGELQPFDSVYIKTKNVLDSARNEIKKIVMSKNGSKIEINTYSKDYYNTSFKKYVYEGDFLEFESKNILINTYYKKKKNKQSVEKQKLTSSNYNITHPNLPVIDTNSYKPFLISESIFIDGSGQKTMYIPKLKFSYAENINLKLYKIDTVNEIIYLLYKDLTFRYNKSLKNSEGLIKYNIIMFRAKEKRELLNHLYYPFLEKDYALLNPPNIYTHNYKSEFNHTSYFEEKVYESTIIKKIYTLNNIQLNGKYFFGDVKLFNSVDSSIHYGLECSDFSINSIVNFTNGELDGTTQEIGFYKKQKHYPTNFKSYFFNEKNKSKASYYGENNYKNGLKYGLSLYSYRSHSNQKKDKNQSKSFIQTFETNYINDTLHGVNKNYFENGNLAYDTHYDMGRPDCEYKEYFENGDLRVSYVFDKGKLNGVYQNYNMDNDHRYLLEYAKFQKQLHQRFVDILSN